MSSTQGLQLLQSIEDAIPKRSIMRLLRRGFRYHPSKNLLVWKNKSITYGDAYIRSYALALYLRYSLELDAGDMVLLVSHNNVEFPMVVAAAEALGLSIALQSTLASVDETKRLFGQIEPSLVISDSDRVCELAHEVDPGLRVMGWHLSYNCRPLKAVIHMQVEVDRYELKMEKAVESQVVLFSSGSTGLPKPIVNRASSFFNNAQKLVDALGIGSDDVLYVPVPFSHVYGFLGVHAALLADATLVSAAKYTPESSLGLQASARTSVFFGVTTMYVRELRVNEEDDWDLSSLRVGLIAGASCPENVFETFEDRYGCTLIQSYGMTETAATLTLGDRSDPQSIRAKSVGRATPGTSVTIDPVSNEILCKTDALMEGILRNGVLEPPDLDEAGWFHTGDMGVFDSSGRLYITGRIKDMVIRGGINIFPTEIENIYQDHPNVAECYMVGYPDPELGERTCLCVQLRHPGADTSYDLREYARGRIEKCKYPDAVLKMDDFPRLGNGKINRKRLKEDVAKILDPARRCML